MSDLLLERAAELAAINRAVRVARAGCGRLVVVSGPPGSGRTALLERARATAAAAGLTVLAASGEPREQGFPFALARRLLEFVGDGPDERYERFVQLHRSLARLAPALVVVDDLRWADRESLEWLAFAVRRLQRTGIAVVVVADDQLAADGLILRLQPLSERAVAVLLHVELGHAVDARFAAALHRATGGRPLLVHELAVAARRARVLDSEDGEAWLASALPPAVVDFAARCLCVAAPPARALAPALALLGTRGSLHQAAALAGLAPDEAVTGVRRLARSRVARRRRDRSAAARSRALRRHPTRPPSAHARRGRAFRWRGVPPAAKRAQRRPMGGPDAPARGRAGAGWRPPAGRGGTAAPGGSRGCERRAGRPAARARACGAAPRRRERDRPSRGGAGVGCAADASDRPAGAGAAHPRPRGRRVGVGRRRPCGVARRRAAAARRRGRRGGTAQGGSGGLVGAARLSRRRGRLCRLERRDRDRAGPRGA